MYESVVLSASYLVRDLTDTELSADDELLP